MATFRDNLVYWTCCYKSIQIIEINLNVKNYGKNVGQTFEGASAPLDNYYLKFGSMLFTIWHYITADVIWGYDAFRNALEKQKGEFPYDNFLRWYIDRCDYACMYCPL